MSIGKPLPALTSASVWYERSRITPLPTPNASALTEPSQNVRTGCFLYVAVSSAPATVDGDSGS